MGQCCGGVGAVFAGARRSALPLARCRLCVPRGQHTVAVGAAFPRVRTCERVLFVTRRCRGPLAMRRWIRRAFARARVALATTPGRKRPLRDVADYAVRSRDARSRPYCVFGNGHFGGSRPVSARARGATGSIRENDFQHRFRAVEILATDDPLSEVAAGQPGRRARRHDTQPRARLRQSSKRACRAMTGCVSRTDRVPRPSGAQFERRLLVCGTRQIAAADHFPLGIGKCAARCRASLRLRGAASFCDVGGVGRSNASRRSGRIGSVSAARFSRLTCAYDIGAEPPPRLPAVARAGITKVIRRRANDDVAWTSRAARSTLVAGDNGAGKST